MLKEIFYDSCENFLPEGCFCRLNNCIYGFSFNGFKTTMQSIDKIENTKKKKKTWKGYGVQVAVETEKSKFCLQLRNETLLVTAEIHHSKLTDSWKMNGNFHG